MGLSPKLLGADEHVILHLRTHPKALFLPILALLLLAAALGFGLALLPPAWGPIAQWALIGVVIVAVCIVTVAPFLRWLSSTYTITDRRIITRRGILNIVGHDLPLTRINNVAYERSLTDRMLGCGTLIVETAADEPLTLPDVPNVERVHVAMTELLFGNPDAAEDDVRD